jgi:hypothetical protein
VTTEHASDILFHFASTASLLNVAITLRALLAVKHAFSNRRVRPCVFRNTPKW